MDIISSPMRDIKGYLTREQVERLLAAATNLRDRLILQLMYRCGRRVSEVLALRKEDILWDEKMIAFTILKRKRPLKEIKPVDSETLAMLKEYIENGCKNIKKGPKDKLFPVTRQYVFKYIRQLGKKTGIEKVGTKKIHPHHLRHSFAVYAVKSGSIKTTEDLRKLQMLMAHASISTTAHYLQFSPTELKDVVSKMWERPKSEK
jgi:integrase/recombinase XerD